MSSLGGSSRQLQRLQAVTDAALAPLRLDELLAELLRRIRAILEVDAAAVLLLDEPSGELVVHATVGPANETGLASRVAAERQPIVLEDDGHAEIGVPLLVRDAVIGVLHVGADTPREFGGDDIELLQFVADRVALAVEHERLFEAERRVRRRLEHVQAVTDVALAHLGLEELLAELLQRIRAILEVDTTAMLLLDESGRELVARAAVGLEEEVERGVRIPVGGGFAGRVAAERRPIILPDVDHADVLNPLLREKGIKTLLGVPLLVHDTVIGVLHVGSLTPREFTGDDVELLRLVADRVALAIERARVHEETVQLDQLKLNFVAIASHELRTPATAVYGALATLRGRDDLAPETRDELEQVAWQESDRLRRLIEQLLDLSRLDASSVRVTPKPLVLRQELEQIVAAVGDGDIVVDVDPGLAVVADPLVIERVVSNLLSNARSYGRPPILVEAASRDRHLRIAVEDSGAGVPEELQSRLFDRFERGPHGRGSGLGLTIAKAYAAAHGGDLVYLPSRRGARFELILPNG